MPVAPRARRKLSRLAMNKQFPDMLFTMAVKTLSPKPGKLIIRIFLYPSGNNILARSSKPCRTESEKSDSYALLLSIWREQPFIKVAIENR
jgi:hypothetical protein